MAGPTKEQKRILDEKLTIIQHRINLAGGPKRAIKPPSEKKERAELYPTKRIYVVIDARGRIVDSMERPIELAKNWRCYLGKVCDEQVSLPEKSEEERDFLAHWQGKKEYDVIIGVADSLEAMVSTIPEIAKRHKVQ